MQHPSPFVDPGYPSRGSISLLITRDGQVFGDVRLGPVGDGLRTFLELQDDITERTARTYVSNILGKLGLASWTQAALYAVSNGLAC